MGNISDIYGGDFDTQRDDAATGGFDPLPAGWYPVMIETADIKENSKHTGSYLKLKMSVLDNPAGFAGRKLFHNITLTHSNEKAALIGQQELAGLGQACGITALTDSAQLLNLALQCRVKVQTSDEYGSENKCTGFKGINVTTESAPAHKVPPVATRPPSTTTNGAPASATPAEPKAPAPGKLPWERN